ncbi:MAG: NarK/NasA family nitrate transporter [Acidobacteria bacterium]|nr:NarK/NasA family nitrate transporter [Acidobacteriota bacterium]
MKLAGFLKAGHTPTLLAAFLYFDVSFMAWVLLGPLGPFIAESYKLSATQKGFLVALPLLAGSFFRPLLGILGDVIGPRRAGLCGLILTLIPLFVGWRFISDLHSFYLVGFLLGIAGASFAVALPLAGTWYPAEYQGLAMGIAGAGNSGTLLATLFAPRLAQAMGWANAFALAMIPVLVVLVVYALLARDSPKRPPRPAWQDYVSVFRQADTAWFCFFYCFTFGAFVGLASFLTLFFHDQYHLPRVRAGDFTTLIVIAGSFLRPVGGWLADRIGGYRLLLALLAGVGCLLFAISSLPALPVVVTLFFLSMGMLGMGNGAVFQLVPQRFSKHVGVVTGLVGAAGGLGGFLLPSLLGTLKDKVGTYGAGFLLFAIAFLIAAAVLFELGRAWSATWDHNFATRAGVFNYREMAKALVIADEA